MAQMDWEWTLRTLNQFGFELEDLLIEQEQIGLPEFQPNYKPIKRWYGVLTGTNKALKRKAIVAVARQLFIDIWRMRTGRITAQELGLVMSN